MFLKNDLYRNFPRIATSLVIPARFHNALLNVARHDAPLEAYACLECGLSFSAEHMRWTVKTVHIPKPEDYEIQTTSLCKVKDEWFRNALGTIARNGHDAVIYHTHPFAKGDVIESCIDEQSAWDNQQAIQEACPGMIPATIVINHDFSEADARYVDQKTNLRHSIDKICIYHPSHMQHIVPAVSPLRAGNTFNENYWSRLALAIGPEFPRISRHFTIGVVGAGSLGEPIIQQCANLGFKTLILDSDLFSEENVNRSLFGSIEDVRVGRNKTELQAAFVRKGNPDAHTEVILGDIREQAIQEQLIKCDGLIAVTDNLTSRFVAQHLCLTHGIPYFDGATGIDVENGRLTSARGQIIKSIPGDNFCHFCSQFFDYYQGMVGLLTESEYEAARRKGYVEGALITAPSVLPINYTLGSILVWEVLRYFSGAGVEHGKQYDIITLEMQDHQLMRHIYERDQDGYRTNCNVCGERGCYGEGCNAPYLIRQKERKIPEFLAKE